MRAVLLFLACACTQTESSPSAPPGSAAEREVVEVLIRGLTQEPALVVKEEPLRSPVRCPEASCGVDPKLWAAFEAARRDGHLPALPERLQKLLVPEVLHEVYAGPPTLRFSPIGFSGNRAIAKVNYLCGSTCGFEVTQLLEHDAKGWHVVKNLAYYVN